MMIKGDLEGFKDNTSCRNSVSRTFHGRKIHKELIKTVKFTLGTCKSQSPLVHMQNLSSFIQTLKNIKFILIYNSN